MAESPLSNSENEAKAWRIAHQQLTKAVNEATQRVNNAKMKRRVLLEALCTNITTEGKLASTSKWEVLPMFQPSSKPITKLKAKKTKSSKSEDSVSASFISPSKITTTTTANKESQSGEGQSDTATSNTKNAKTKAKPRLKVKVKSSTKSQTEKSINDSSTKNNKAKDPSVSRGKKRPADVTEGERNRSILHLTKSKTTENEIYLEPVNELQQKQQQIHNLNQQILISQQPEQQIQNDDEDFDKMQRQPFEIDRHKSTLQSQSQPPQQFHSNGMMGMNFYHRSPDVFMSHPYKSTMESQMMDTAMLQRTLAQQQQEQLLQQRQQQQQQQQQQQPQHQQLHLDFLSQQQNMHNHP